MRIGVMVSDDFLQQAFSPEDRRQLEALGDVDCELGRIYNSLDEQEQIRYLGNYDVLLGGWGSGRLPDDYVPQHEQYYCMCTGTVARQLTPVHLERGMRLTNWGDAISHYISESALMQILASVRMVGLHYQATHVNKVWRDGLPPTQSLFERCVGLLGFGVIAQKLVPLLKPFQARVHAFDPYVSDACMQAHDVERADSIRALFEQCDIISNHLPKVPETDDAINAAMLALLPDHGIVVNTARGNSLDEQALVAEHRRGRLFSALDVFKTEPLPHDHPLRDEPRCIIMCHQGGPTHDGYKKMGQRALENIRRYKNAEPLLQEIDADKLRRMT